MPYTAFDRFVAWWRFRVALPHLFPQARVCDVGCGMDARFLRFARPKISLGIGLDYQRPSSSPAGPPLLQADITQGLPFRGEAFNHIVLLAVLEHIQQPKPLFSDAFRVLAPGGSLIMTWPQGAIDPLLAILQRVGWVSRELEGDKHQPRIPLPELLALLNGIGFERCRHQKFEFGLNNLLVCFKPMSRSAL